MFIVKGIIKKVPQERNETHKSLLVSFARLSIELTFFAKSEAPVKGEQRKYAPFPKWGSLISFGFRSSP